VQPGRLQRSARSTAQRKLEGPTQCLGIAGSDVERLPGLSRLQPLKRFAGEYNGKFMSGQMVLRAVLRNAGGAHPLQLPQLLPPGDTLEFSGFDWLPKSSRAALSNVSA